MAVNPYFNNHGYKPTQDLINDLVKESIRIHGINCFYMPREFKNMDSIFGEDTSAVFKYAFPIEMHLETATGYDGDREVVTKLGLENKDVVRLLVSKDRFIHETIAFRKYFTNRQIERPTEGDLIYLPLDSGLYEIKFADQDADFYQGGKVYSFRLTCEKVRYSYEQINVNNEDINTGINNQFEQIDNDNDGIIDEFNIKPDGTPPSNPNNDDLNTLSGDVYDFTENDPFSGGNY
jgi:hypothetical protein